jgi:hypothetical protein
VQGGWPHLWNRTRAPLDAPASCCFWPFPSGCRAFSSGPPPYRPGIFKWAALALGDPPSAESPPSLPAAGFFHEATASTRRTRYVTWVHSMSSTVGMCPQNVQVGTVSPGQRITAASQACAYRHLRSTFSLGFFQNDREEGFFVEHVVLMSCFSASGARAAALNIASCSMT